MPPITFLPANHFSRATEPRGRESVIPDLPALFAWQRGAQRQSSPTIAHAEAGDLDGRGLWVRKRVVRPVAEPESPAQPVRPVHWIIRLEYQRRAPGMPPMVVALLQARTPSTDLLNLAQVHKGAMEIMLARGFNESEGECKARPMVDLRTKPPTTPPDWTGPRLELWFTRFTEQAMLVGP